MNSNELRSFSACGKDTPFDELKKNEGENFKTLYQGMKSLGGVPFMIKSSDMSGTIPDEKVGRTAKRGNGFMSDDEFLVRPKDRERF